MEKVYLESYTHILSHDSTCMVKPHRQFLTSWRSSPEIVDVQVLPLGNKHTLGYLAGVVGWWPSRYTYYKQPNWEIYAVSNYRSTSKIFDKTSFLVLDQTRIAWRNYPLCWSLMKLTWKFHLRLICRIEWA